MTSSIDTDFLIRIRAQMEREIITMENILEEKREIFSKLSKNILNSCNHKWIEDYIDTHDNVSTLIKYCEKCESSYNTTMT